MSNAKQRMTNENGTERKEIDGFRVIDEDLFSSVEKDSTSNSSRYRSSAEDIF